MSDKIYRIKAVRPTQFDKFNSNNARDSEHRPAMLYQRIDQVQPGHQDADKSTFISEGEIRLCRYNLPGKPKDVGT